MRKLLAVLGAILLSACMEEPASTMRVSYETPIYLYEPQFSDETGALIVTVLDESIQVVPGANVGLAETGQTATTSLLGEAGFDYLAPGQYELTINATDFAENRRIVKIEPGTATSVRVTLERVPTKEPYIFHSEKSGTWQCGAGHYQDKSGSDNCAGRVRPQDPVWANPTKLNWTGGVFEARAPPSSSFSPRNMKATFWMNGTDDKVHKCILSAKGPVNGFRLEFRANQEIPTSLACDPGGLGNAKATKMPPGPNPYWTIAVRPYPGDNLTDFYIYIDQRWNAWLALFVNQEMPTGYSSLPDS